jgi:hypothetical protein
MMDDDLTDDELIALARSWTPTQLLEMLGKAARLDEAAEEAARQARRRLNLLIAVGLERNDVINRRMAEITRLKERTLYKRPGHL